MPAALVIKPKCNWNGEMSPQGIYTHLLLLSEKRSFYAIGNKNMARLTNNLNHEVECGSSIENGSFMNITRPCDVILIISKHLARGRAKYQ